MLVGTTPRGTVQRSGTPKTPRFNKVVHTDPQSSSLPKLPRAKTITREHAATLSSSMPASSRLDLGKLKQSPLTPRRFTAKEAKESLSSTNRRAKLRSVKSEEPSPRITRQRSDAFSEADDAPDPDSSPLRKVKSLDDSNIESGSTTEPLRRRAITEMTFAPVFGKFPKKQISFNEKSTAPSLRKQHTVPAIPNFERARLDRLTTSTSPTKKDAEGYAKRHQALSPRSAEVPAHLRSRDCIAEHIKANILTKQDSPKKSARGIRLPSARKYLPTETRRKQFQDNRVYGQRNLKEDPSVQAALSNPLQEAALLFESAFTNWGYPMLPTEAFSMHFIDRNLSKSKGASDEQRLESGNTNIVSFKKYEGIEGVTERVLKKETKLNPFIEQVRHLKIDPNKPMLLQRNLAFYLACKFLGVEDLSPEIDAGIHKNELHTVMSVAPGEPGTGNKEMKRIYLLGKEYGSLFEAAPDCTPEDLEDCGEYRYDLKKLRAERNPDGTVQRYADKDKTPILTCKVNLPAERPVTDPQEKALVEAFDLLQILDYVFCQIDRHLGNVFVEVEEDLDNPIVINTNGVEQENPRYKFKRLTGIDGDFALPPVAFTAEFLGEDPKNNAAGLPPNPSEAVMKIVEGLGESSKELMIRSHAIANDLLSDETAYILELIQTQSISECIEAIREQAEEVLSSKQTSQAILALFNKVCEHETKANNYIQNTEGRILIKLFNKICQPAKTKDSQAEIFLEKFDPKQGMNLQKNLRSNFPKSPQEAVTLFRKYASEDAKKFLAQQTDPILETIFEQLSDPKVIEVVKGHGCKTLANILKNLGFNYHIIAAAETRYDYTMAHFKKVRSGELNDIEEDYQNSYAFRFKTQHEANEANAKLMGPEDFAPKVNLPPKNKRPRSKSYNLRKSLTKLSLGGRKTSPQKISKGLSTGNLSD